MPEQLPWQAEIIERIQWLVKLRWLAVIGAVIVISVASVRLPGVLPTIHLFALNGFIALYNLFFYLYVHEMRGWDQEHLKLRCSTVLIHAQIVLDLLCLTLLLHYSGGIESPFSAYYVLHIIIASILLSRVAAFGYAALATGLYALVAIGESSGILYHVHLAGIVDPDLYRRETYIIAAVFALATTLFFAVYIASSITSQLRQREIELAEARSVCQLRSDELGMANERLQELDKAKTYFLLTVTHELRAPVAAIQSYIDLILQGYVEADKQREVLQRSRNRTAELLELIADLLQMARVREMDAHRVELEQVSLATTMKEVLALLQGQADEKGQTVKTYVQSNLPAVQGREDHLKLIWTNLISNAIKYTPDEGQINIRIERNSDKGWVIGSVKDTGIGIPPDSLSRVFEEFYRTDEAKQMSARGTGLGLSITKRLIETYGGKIDVQSEMGKGTKFTFSMRAADD
jgi:signal transduction histidine kinase